MLVSEWVWVLVLAMVLVQPWLWPWALVTVFPLASVLVSALVLASSRNLRGGKLGLAPWDQYHRFLIFFPSSAYKRSRIPRRDSARPRPS